MFQGKNHFLNIRGREDVALWVNVVFYGKLTCLMCLVCCCPFFPSQWYGLMVLELEPKKYSEKEEVLPKLIFLFIDEKSCVQGHPFGLVSLHRAVAGGAEGGKAIEESRKGGENDSPKV